MDQSQLHQPRIALAVNRQLGFQVLQHLGQAGMTPCALLVPKGRAADMWTAKSIDLFQSLVGDEPVFQGKSFRDPQGVEQLRASRMDYLISIHFPYIVPKEVLELPRIGTLNLHPAFLPYNRGWHTPSWAIADGTPYGATLHWMDEGVDTGDVALQKQVEVLPGDTANRLYRRVLEAEFELFCEAVPALLENRLPRVPQSTPGTEHSRADLKSFQSLDLQEKESVQTTLNKLRALTTSDWAEAAFFEEDGVRYHVQVDIRPAAAQPSIRKAA